ncbi:MAG: patatin-like phospholipase family protein [Chitinophagales bacterium]|nr:patatin-like phospholipase family protein [Chitinophagales bacterium]
MSNTKLKKHRDKKYCQIVFTYCYHSLLIFFRSLLPVGHLIILIFLLCRLLNDGQGYELFIITAEKFDFTTHHWWKTAVYVIFTVLTLRLFIRLVHFFCYQSYYKYRRVRPHLSSNILCDWKIQLINTIVLSLIIPLFFIIKLMCTGDSWFIGGLFLALLLIYTFFLVKEYLFFFQQIKAKQDNLNKARFWVQLKKLKQLKKLEDKINEAILEHSISQELANDIKAHQLNETDLTEYIGRDLSADEEAMQELFKTNQCLEQKIQRKRDEIWQKQRSTDIVFNNVLNQSINRKGRILRKSIQGSGKYIILLLLLIPALLFWPKLSLCFGEVLPPAPIVIFCILFLILIIHNIIRYVGNNYIFNLFILILWLGLCSLVNNNHKITTSTNTIDRESIDDRYMNWVTQKGFHKDSTDNYIFLIASEGGGIRSAYWTVEMLHKLSMLDSLQFLNNTFSISGVSGGSVGAALYTTLRRDALLDNNEQLLDKHRDIVSDDFLSPLLIGFCFTDLIQKLIPFRIESWDRAKILKYTWEDVYSEHTSKNTLEEGLASVFDKNYELPILLLNGTRVEDGSKVIMSNVSINHTAFKNNTDLINTIGKDIPISTAALLSARFPLITPAGKICKGSSYWGNVVDGGYYDNSGLETTFEVLQMIRGMNKDLFPDAGIKPVVIFLRNSKNVVNPPIKKFHEIKNPINAFYNAWNARGFSIIPKLKQMQDFKEVTYLTFQLNREKYDVPLGWSIAQKTRKQIDQCVESIGYQLPERYDIIDSLNWCNYQALIDLIR